MTLRSLRLALADILRVTRDAFAHFGDHECAQRGAALAYYAMFSMFPLLLLLISLLGFLLEAGVPLAVDAQTAVLQAVEQTLPQAKDLVENIIMTTRRARGGTGLVGLIVLAWSASSIFTQARLALNAVWDTGQPQGLGGVLRLRLNALGMVIATGLLLFVSVTANTSLDLIAHYATRLPWSDTLWPLVLPLILAGNTVVLFALLYRILSRAPLGWSDVWPGAVVGGVGWEALKKVFVWYAGTAADWGAIYGPIAGVIALLLWLYLSAQVFLFGAEFAAAYSHLMQEKRAAEPLPAETEVPVELDEPSAGDLSLPAPAPVPPSKVDKGTELARGTVVGLVGAGVAGGLALVGLLATGRRLLSQRSSADSD
jgi:membrane protein